MTRIFVIFFLGAFFLGATPIWAEQTATENKVEESDDFDRFKLIQPESIHFTFIDFYYHETIKQVQAQMLSIPGMSDFIPYLAAPGLITYDLRYSGPAKLLMKALQDVFGTRYELGMKEIGDKAWEITMRKVGGKN